uniref:Uncharacterized protein n=1 Tax=Anguilla anguilla TaxID=7936 RepID=A0A0E9U745_ANGAN
MCCQWRNFLKTGLLKNIIILMLFFFFKFISN